MHTGQWLERQTLKTTDKDDKRIQRLQKAKRRFNSRIVSWNRRQEQRLTLQLWYQWAWDLGVQCHLNNSLLFSLPPASSLAILHPTLIHLLTNFQRYVLLSLLGSQHRLLVLVILLDLNLLDWWTKRKNSDCRFHPSQNWDSMFWMPWKLITADFYSSAEHWVSSNDSISSAILMKDEGDHHNTSVYKNQKS